MGSVYVVARYLDDGDGRWFAIMRDMDGNGAFGDINHAQALIDAAERSGAYDGSYFRIISLQVKEA